ncbi:hypothetical protein QTI66_32420 [Variovorax sp. J22R133]|uniref:hypothetical protein n=1 Tax=Variovorax brevis TaxID=3053503 RepID=UPI002575A723|nr:hypothetical protein [Variovorax sp. J22R133]MDM0116836.1 hypothetical protein [Variovorax sp. J22R133]
MDVDDLPLRHDDPDAVLHRWQGIADFCGRVAEVRAIAHAGDPAIVLEPSGVEIGAHAVGVALRALVQGPGTAWRITTGNFPEELPAAPRCTHVLMAVATSADACDRTAPMPTTFP